MSSPPHYESVQSWDALVRRVRQLTQGDQGVAVTTITVYTNCGAPVGWQTPTVTKIEPKGSSDAFAEALSLLCAASST